MTSTFFNLISYTSWLSVTGKTSCKLHKMCFRRFVGTSTSRVFKIQNGFHVNKNKMRFYSRCGSCFVVKPSVCILPLVGSLQSAFYPWSAFYPRSAFYPWSAFYPRSAVRIPQSAFYTDRLQASVGIASRCSIIRARCPACQHVYITDSSRHSCTCVSAR